MEYNFRDIEKKWQQKWMDNAVYKVPNESSKPKYYVLDMFPYPSGAGLHVGHPLGYIASDIYARYKRLKGFNVLHPMGYDAFGLPAEQYAIEHGVHPAVSTEKNISTFRSQLDKIGFSYDWDREVRTSDPKYYKWTQWIFLQLFKSFFNRNTNKAEPIENLIAAFETEGNKNHPVPDAKFEIRNANFEVLGGKFSADQWKSFDEKTKQDILMEYRLAYCGYGEVNWCEALGTVLANDEVVNGVSERGGYPVVKKKLRQWYLRITEYADRLLEGLQKVDFSDAMKEMQSNWIGKSSGAEIKFEIAPSRPSPAGKEIHSTDPRHHTADSRLYNITKELAERKRKEPTFEEGLLWQHLRNDQTGFHIRRQHIIGSYIVDFACIDKMLTIEIDGGYHLDPRVKQYDETRTEYLKSKGFKEIRFTNEQVRIDITSVVEEIKKQLSNRPSSRKVSPEGGGLEGAYLTVYTTRPDTIFGVDFMVLAPEHDLVEQITTADQKQAVEDYIAYVKSRSERERMAEKKISGVFTGAYALHPFDTNKKIPVWISEYVLAGYGTGAIMAVPSGDERDHKFAKHFNLPITNILGDAYNGEEANPTKDAVLSNSGFLNGMVMRDAIEVVINKLEEMGIGKRKVNYKMRDAAFSRQRYWGEPFPIKWIPASADSRRSEPLASDEAWADKNGIAYPLNESELPLELPHVENYKPGPEGEGPLANIPEWTSQHLETNTMPGYAGSSWYFLRYMDPHNDKEFCNKKYSDYWQQVDLYVGGTEHAVGHLLYSRMWTKALYDLGLISFDEPFKKLLNQGMIQGVSAFVNSVGFIFGRNARSTFSKEDENNYSLLREKYIIIKDLYLSEDLIPYLRRIYTDPSTEDEKKHDEIGNKAYAYLATPVLKDIELLGLKDKVDIMAMPMGMRHYKIHIPIQYVDHKNVLDEEKLKKESPRFENATFLTLGNEFICSREVEKMSKSKLNTVNPDDIILDYGADTFRMYEMFLGPVEMSKPWDTKGIEGVHRFLKKLWRLFFLPDEALAKSGDDQKGKLVTEEKATNEELKVLHRTIKKIEEDTERFSYNTAVSAFMVCVNELTDLKCHKREILEPLLILLAPYAPHIAEELYHQLGSSQVSPPTGGGDLEGAATTILDAPFPKLEEKYLVETSKEYPISVNGKLRTTINIDLNAAQPEVEEIVLANPVIQKWMEGKQPKKVIYVKGKMVNVVV